MAVFFMYYSASVKLVPCWRDDVTGSLLSEVGCVAELVVEAVCGDVCVGAAVICCVGAGV